MAADRPQPFQGEVWAFGVPYLAQLLPARKALRVQPTVALRSWCFSATSRLPIRNPPANAARKHAVLAEF
jgi:hypothetical protein